MFGLKGFTKAKTKSFASDKDRKRYFAIQNSYKKQGLTAMSKTKKSKKR